MDYSTIFWTGPFLIEVVSGYFLSLHVLEKILFKMQTEQILIRRRGRIWVYTVFQCPFYRTLGKYGLKQPWKEMLL